VLETALDLLLERQERARGQAKRPGGQVSAPAARRSARMDAERAIEDGDAVARSRPSIATAAAPANDGQVGQQQAAASLPPELPPFPPPFPPPARRAGPREHVPAAVRRAVWTRDAGRCQWPLDSGGSCGSTHQLELDHVVPWARGGAPTVEGLRLLCRRHNRLAARLAFGERCMRRYAAPAAGDLSL
jgi:hypothetical protein